MKNLFGILLLISLFSITPVFAGEKELKGTITLSGAWAIYPTAVTWGEAFKEKHPGVRVDVSAGGAGKGASDAIAGLVDIGMVSREPDPAEIKRGIIPIYILHDAIFPIVSDKSPVLKEILKKGLSKKTFTDIYITGKVTKWGEALGNTDKKPIHVYTRSDSAGAPASWANFLGNKKQEDLRGVGIYGDPGELEAVKRDPVGIGYNNFSFVFTREGALMPGIRLVPIDANENGIADPDEIYTTRNQAVKAIEAGNYPATRKNYFYVKTKPQGLVKAFIEFALSAEGTKIVDLVGASLPVPKVDREIVLKEITAK